MESAFFSPQLCKWLPVGHVRYVYMDLGRWWNNVIDHWIETISGRQWRNVLFRNLVCFFFYSQKCQQWLNTHFGTTIGFKFRWSNEVIQKIWKDFYVHWKVILISWDRHFFLTAAEKKITRFGDLVVTSVEVLSLILLKFYIMKWLFHWSLSDNEYCFLSRVKKKWEIIYELRRP